jgi:plasmid stabilization system protein ParE
MKLSLHRADRFNSDFRRQYHWYLEEASEDVAKSYLRAVENTIELLLIHPDLGQRQRFRNPILANIRSSRVESPFQNLLVFYRHHEKELSVERLMHGARDLPRRLTEPQDS